jgi:hypothetical protein
VFDAAGAHMFETAVGPFVLIDYEADDVLNIEYVETALDLFNIETFHKIQKVL